MAARGISIVDLLGLPPGSTSLVPADIRAELAKLAVVDFTVITSDAAFIYSGTIRSLGEAFFSSSLNWPIELPMLNVGVPFQLVRRRLPLVGDIEPAPDGFQLDLLLNRVAIAIPGLQPAVAIPGVDVTPTHLVRPIAGQPLFGKRVKIVGSGTLRIASAPGGGAPVIRFVAPPDPFDPDAPTGALVGLTFEPASFFLGSSDYGLTVDQLLYDDSEAFTPADIEARGQGPEWRGISIKEATLYFPRSAPAVGDLSVGVRDVLLGSPLGLQGEVRIEFGTTPVNPATISVTQHQVGTPPADVALGSPVPAAGPRTYQVQLSGLAGSRALVSARGPEGSTNRWTLPDRTIIIDSTTGQFAVEAGDTLRVAGVEGAAGDLAVSPEVTILFVPQAAASLPAITVTSGGEVRSGVLSMSGTQEILSGFAYTLDPATDPAFEWQFGEGVSAQTARGASFTPVIPATPGLYFLSVGKPDGVPQRLRIEVLAEGALLIGCRAGLFDISAPVGVRAVEGTYRLPSFNRRGDMDPSPDNATLVGGVVSVPAGDLASVTADWGGGGPPPPPATQVAVSRHVQVLMQFDHTTPTGWVADADGDGTVEVITADDQARAKLAEWTAKWSGAQFIVVGRTCDIGTPSRNQTLSAERGAAGKALLGGAAAFQRGERFQWGEAGADAGAALEGMSTIDADERAKTGTNPTAAPDYDGWLFKIRTGGGFAGDPSTTAHDRPLFRRADFYAVGGTPVADPAAPADAASQAATELRRALIPGTLPPALVPLAPRDVATPYRVRLVVRWDSPTVTELSDAIPTQAELTIAWQGRSIPVPGGVGDVTPTASQPQQVDGHEVFTLIGGWTYDPRTTATQFSLALNSTGDPDGLAMLTGDSAPMNAVATAFALGPALLAGIGAGDVAGGVTRVAALVAAIGFAAAFGKDGKVVFHGVKVEWRQRAISSVEGARFRLLCDYTAAIGFDFDQFGIRIVANKPIKVRYRDVGIEIDSARSGFEAFGVVYENASFDIEDPGQWVINGPLGELIRVAGTRAGSGSTWVELDLKFALDLGVVKITGCTLRASFTNGGLGIEFRGFSASVDLPGVISGTGSVSIGDGGLIRAGLAATIVPINTSASASLALQGDFVALEVGVILPVGIPLAQSGLAIYGFVGRVVSNGKRDFTSVAATDPVGRELGWYELPGAQKYAPAPGQWAMGLGISIGTMPDTGFTFNALGMVSVGFPDPDVVISIDAKLFDRPALPDEEKPPSPAGSLRILGVIAISPRAVVVGVRGSYLIPKVLKLELPFGAYFPLPGNPDPAFVRIGADGINGRTGDPVSLTLLPGTLDIGVWAYAMVEERNLIRLGDVAGFDLNGFSIGFGAGWAMQWGGGPIYLRASAKILAGLGTKPLTIVAGLFIEGELRLIIVSVSVRGNVKALITEQSQLFSGEFCGKVDFFFFSVEGCVDVEFGSGSDPGVPVPDHPLTRVDLTQRTGAIVGRAYRAGETVDPQRPALAWPDTVPLLNFAAYVQNRLAGSSFAPVPAELPGEPWSGSSELKYAYRLTSLAIRKSGGAALPGPIESVWWWPTHRGGVLDPEDAPPSANEGRQLALLSWHPTPWSRNIADGGKDTPADPGGTVGNLCTPIRDRFRTCVRGDMLVRESLEAVRLSGPPGTRFAAIVAEGLPGSTSLADAAAALALAGWSLHAGEQRAFAPPINVPSGPSAVTAGYRLASIMHGPVFVATLGARIEPTLALDDAVLTLELCVGARQGSVGGCDDYGDLAIGTQVDGTLRRPGVTYQWQSDLWKQASPIVDHFAPDRDGRAELWVGSKGVVAKLDVATEHVELTVAYSGGEPITAIAMDASGAMVARAVATDVLREAQVLVLHATSISAVQVFGGGDGRKISIEGGGSLLKFCIGQGGGGIADELRTLIARGGDAQLPRVQARMPDGKLVTLTARGVGAGNVDLGPGSVLRAAVRRCALVQYTVPAGRTATELVISPWTGGQVTVVSLCGTDWVTRYIQTVNGDAQAGTAGSLGDHSDPSTSERPNLLDADTDYEIVVGMQWVGWRKPRNAPANAGPPPISDALAWQDFPEAVHRFRTSPAAVLPANPPPADFKDERTFDPRGLMRYFLGFRPDGLGAPHFLGDTIKVDFRADHIAPLLAKYGRDLRLKLRRTDPPPASLAGPGGLGGSLPPPLVPMMIVVGLLDKFLLEPSDLLLVNAAEDAPCVPNPPAVGGRTLDITAPLEPDADYDLLLVAPPAATPDVDMVLITRGHFHTSRYASPSAMLAAMALPITGNPDPRLPTDALVAPGLPAAVAAANDAAFEVVLRALGLDPWPLPTLPRVVALWSRTAPFHLHGIMLETDEPLERPGRMAVASITIAGVALQRIVANTATTRMIWMAATPLLLAGDAVISVAVLDGAATITGRRSILKLPRMAFLEGLA
ncbi:hypothetical protein [Sandarakinorhabdus sp. DWP1-3-1]|uniref:hypothetical protein n=1 Tax=Sandarakinorhabdus sp. DWP1-3-1 TaxID=2804627 RepID=UPI003CF0B056